MSKKLSLLIVANNCKWKDWEGKIQKLREWFEPKVDLTITLRHTSYDTIPFSPYFSSEPDQATMQGLMGVDRNWYDANITPLAIGNDLVLFVINLKQWGLTNRARGWRADRDQGPVEMQIGCDEKTPKPMSFMQIARHEILHALFMLTGQPDTTHKWWDVGQLENALAEVAWPVPNNAELMSLLQKLLLALMPQPQPNNYPKIETMLLAMQGMEGYFPPGPNYPTGSKSWRNHNPLNLKFANQVGSTGQDKTGFAIFPDYATGLAAGRRQILLACQGKSKVYSPSDTFYRFFEKYAPSFDDNNPSHYAEVVCGKLNVSPTEQIKWLMR